MGGINKIGVFIRNGLTSAEIKEKVKDFPDNPDKDYFMSLGYSEKTAKLYKCTLNRNNSKKSNVKVSTTSKSAMFISPVGSLIRAGLTSEQIREKVKDFPKNPDKQYFISLGYSKKTASTYKSQLAKNNSTLSQQSKAVETDSFMQSHNADSKNIILDTSALGFPEPVSMLNNCEKITVLYSTIREFDKVQKNESKSSYLRKMICEQTNTMLLPQSEQKYNLVTFDWQSNMYVDDIIINYMFSLPANQRPTLLTADHNLALKAKCLKLDYILFLEDSSTSKKEEPEDNKKTSLNQNKAKSKPQNKEKAEPKTDSANVSQQKNEDTITRLGIKIIYTKPFIKVYKYSKSSIIFTIKNNS